jgi:predicted permease
MRIPLLRGRHFTDEENAEDPRVCLIDQKFADTHFAGQDPLGKRVMIGGQNDTRIPLTIIGVVGHVQNYGIGADTRVQLYNPYRQVPPSSVSFVLRTTMDPAALAPAVRAAMREIEPTLPVFSFSTMKADFARSVTNQRIMLTILSCLAGLALLLAAIGLYGVLSYIVGQRTREVGIRMALGATAASVRQLMLGQGLKLALIGLAVGLLGCVGLGRLMGSLLYGVSGFDPVSLVAVSLLLAAIGLLASWLPARRAMQINPTEALRTE